MGGWWPATPLPELEGVIQQREGLHCLLPACTENGDRPAQEGLLVSQREESQQLQGRQQKDRDVKEKVIRALLYFEFQSTMTCQKTFISVRCSVERLGQQMTLLGSRPPQQTPQPHCWSPAATADGAARNCAKPPGLTPLYLPWQQTRSLSLHVTKTRQNVEWGWPDPLQDKGAGSQARPRDRPEGALGSWHRNAHHGMPGSRCRRAAPLPGGTTAMLVPETEH